MFKGCENKEIIGNVVGTIIQVIPDIKVSILSGDVVLDKEHLYICNSIYLDPNKLIEEGDEVLLTHSANEQTWFLIDRVSKL